MSEELREPLLCSIVEDGYGYSEDITVSKLELEPLMSESRRVERDALRKSTFL